MAGFSFRPCCATICGTFDKAPSSIVRIACGDSQEDFSDCKLCLQYENPGVAERD
jgi:hypothetical protein